MYDAILFDLDGTLWDATEASASGWNAALESCGMVDASLSPQDIRKVSGRPFDACVASLFPAMASAERETLAGIIDACERSSVEARGGIAYPGVVGGLALMSRSHPLFLISNCQEWYLQAFWKHVGVQGCFTASDCYGISGVPKSEMMVRTVRRHHLAHPLYIGDTEADELAARSAGVDFGYAAYGFGTASSPALRFESFEEIVARLRGPERD